MAPSSLTQLEQCSSVSVLMPEGDDKDQMQVAESAGEFMGTWHQLDQRTKRRD